MIWQKKEAWSSLLLVVSIPIPNTMSCYPNLSHLLLSSLCMTSSIHHLHPSLPLCPRTQNLLLSQPPSNITKSNSTNKQHTSNPRSNTHTLKRKSARNQLLLLLTNNLTRSISHTRPASLMRRMRRRYKIWVDGEQECGARECDRGGEDEAGACAVEEVPDSWVGESEG